MSTAARRRTDVAPIEIADVAGPNDLHTVDHLLSSLAAEHSAAAELLR